MTSARGDAEHFLRRAIEKAVKRQCGTEREEKPFSDPVEDGVHGQVCVGGRSRPNGLWSAHMRVLCADRLVHLFYRFLERRPCVTSVNGDR